MDHVQVYVVVQESIAEKPTVAIMNVPENSPQESVLARIPLACKDFFGCVPENLVTWRIERFNERWTIFMCRWNEQNGERIPHANTIPDDVLKLLMRYVGTCDGAEEAMGSKRILIDVAAGGVRYGKEFPNGLGSHANEALARASYCAGWQNGIEAGFADRKERRA